jgi:hypothetical protein
MRGEKQEQVSVAYLLNVETMIPPGHPIRVIKRLLAKVLIALDSIRLEWLEQWQVGIHRDVESLGTEHLESFQASAAAEGFVGRLPALPSIL